VNYLLELCAALSLATAVVIAWSRAHLPIHTGRAGLLLLVTFGIGYMVRMTLQDYTWDLRERRAARTELSQLRTLVAETPGPILADEYMGMLTLNGRPLVIQPFEVTQLAWAGKWDQTPLLEGIRDREYSAIILYDRPWLSERWTAEMLDAVRRSYRLVDIIADNKIYKPPAAASTTKIETCPGAPWRLPTDGSLGLTMGIDSIAFYGQGQEASIPVYAVADGLLTRPPDRLDAVAILHGDPQRPEKKVWVFYGDMADANGTDSFVVQDFPPGSTNIPVKSGQLLGYQGSWRGTPPWPKWVHLSILLVDANPQNTLPKEITSADILDPVPYFGLSVDSGNKNLQTLKCEQP
jgi:hypothetical protein